MKTLSFLMIMFIITVAFSSTSPYKFSHDDQPTDITSSTLDGISATRANALVALSMASVDNSPEDTQIWFPRDVIIAWYNLLEAEKSTYNTDGVRIYFTRKLVSNTVPLHYNNRIIVVSTFTKDTVENDTPKKIHEDYFKHLKTNVLFKTRGINGVVYHDKDTSHGALLFHTCNCDTKPDSDAGPHDILRSQAEKMVQRFHRIIIFRKGAIDSKAEWFDLNFIKTLYRHLNDSAVNRTHLDGVRIYFSRGADKDYTYKKAKFVMVTTQPLGIPGDTNKYHKDYFDPKHPAVVNKIRKEKFASYDNGELCPDHCDGIQLPQT